MTSLNVIVGLGDTGIACARYFRKRGLPFAITDSRTHPPQEAAFLKEFKDVEFEFGGFSETLLNKATEIIISPGVSLKEPALAKQVMLKKSIVGDIELFAREAKAPIIGITGSNGKTTVTTMVGLMVEAAAKKVAVCGNIGEPVLHALDAEHPDFYVVELSSFQLETTYSLNPLTATILNVTPDHMDRYATILDYQHAKQRIYNNCQRAVVNQDEPDLWRAVTFSKKPISFSLMADKDADFFLSADERFLMHQRQPLMAVAELKLRSRHSVQNALAALALGYASELPITKMLKVLREFSGLPHRCQWVRQLNGVDYYDDSKGTNIGATEAALQSLAGMINGKIVLIAGGQGKGADFAPLANAIKKHVKQLVLIGEDAPILALHFQEIVPIVYADSMADAVLQSKMAATEGDIVLLSPACASFDMFQNYKHRGEVFVQAVEAL